MSQHICLFTPVHKGLRHALQRLSFQAGSINAEDDHAMQAFASEWSKVVSLLDFHGENEDAFVQPFLERLDQPLANRLEQEHQASEKLLHDLTRDLHETVKRSTEDRKTEWGRFVSRMNQFVAMYWNHMETEEKDLMETLRARAGSEELMEVSVQMRKAVPPKQMLDFLFYMLPAMNVHERTQLLSGMKRNAPQEFFAAVMGVAESVLEKGDFSALQSKLAAM